jgi:hypothetical protein
MSKYKGVQIPLSKIRDEDDDVYETDYTFAIMIWPVQTSKAVHGRIIEPDWLYVQTLGLPAIVSPPEVQTRIPIL